MIVLIILALFLVQAGTSPPEDTYLKRTAASWSNDLKHPDAKIRRGAAFALGKLGKHALPFVSSLKTTLMQDTDVTVRTAGATSLGELGPLASADIAPSLIQALEREKEVTVRAAIVLAIGKVGERAGTAEPMLRKTLDEADITLRQNAAWTLGQLGQAAEPSVPRLVIALKDSEASVRAEVVQALGNLGPLAQEAISPITQALKDRDPRVQEQCIIALRRMGPLASSAIAPLLTVAESTKADTPHRVAALITIESIWPTGLKEPVSWSRLQALAQSTQDDVVKAAAQQAEKKISTMRK